MAVNMMIGEFKPNKNKNIKWLSVCITANSCEAYNQYLQNKGCFIEIITINEVKFFHVYKELESTNIETEKPIYDQILDLEAIALHKLSALIKSKGGIVLDLNTDCISCTFPNDVFPFELIDDKNIEGYYYDDENKVPMYKLEKKNTRLQIERKAQYKRTDTYIYEPKQWTVYNDVEDNDFKPIVDRVIELNGCFITGPAGTGKSQLIRQIKQELQNKGKTFSCLAPTNLAAINIKGTTVHKFVSKLKKMDSLFNLDVDYLFIDEISMLQEIFYKFFIMIKRIKPNLKIIIAGDFNQLPPVKDRIGESFNYSNCQALLELCDFNKVQLSKCRRSDGFVVDFETINNIKKESFKSNFTLNYLAFTNKKRIAINKKCMDAEAQKYKKTKIYV